MNPVECEFEADVLAAVLQSRWPEQVDPDLRTHVAGCAICRDVVVIAGPMDQAREEMLGRAVIPDSGRVWWLSQMRARREAAKAAARPITAAQMIAFACAVGVLGACFGATSTWFQSALATVMAGIAGLKLEALLPSATALVAGHGALILAAAAVLLLVPAALCVAMLRD